MKICWFHFLTFYLTLGTTVAAVYWPAMAKPPSALESVWGSHTHFSQHSPGTWILRGIGQSGPGSITSKLQRGTQPIWPTWQMHWYLQLGKKIWPFWYTEPSKTHMLPMETKNKREKVFFIYINSIKENESSTIHMCCKCSPLTDTDTSPSVDVDGVITLQPFMGVTGVQLRADLALLAGTNQAAGAVIQDQGHPGGACRDLSGTMASSRTHLGPDWC